MTRRIVFGLVVGMVLAWGQDDPFLGTWKLDPARSKFSGETALKAMTVTWQKDGTGFRVSTEGLRADGRGIRESYVAYYDGKEYKNQGPWNFDAVVNRQLDRHTREDSFTKDKRPFGVIRRQVSADGKEMRVTSTFGVERQELTLVRQ